MKCLPIDSIYSSAPRNRSIKSASHSSASASSVAANSSIASCGILSAIFHREPISPAGHVGVPANDGMRALKFKEICHLSIGVDNVRSGAQFELSAHGPGQIANRLLLTL